MGEGPTFQEMNINRVICKECEGAMAVYSLWHHMKRSHAIVLPLIRGVDVEGGGTETYKVSFPRIFKLVE